MEIRLPLATASLFDDAPQAFRDLRSGVSVPSFFFVGPGILPMRCRKAARRPLLPVLSGGLLMLGLPAHHGFFLSGLLAILESLRCWCAWRPRLAHLLARSSGDPLSFVVDIFVKSWFSHLPSPMLFLMFPCCGASSLCQTSQKFSTAHKTFAACDTLPL